MQYLMVRDLVVLCLLVRGAQCSHPLPCTFVDQGGPSAWCTSVCEAVAEWDDKQQAVGSRRPASDGGGGGGFV